MLIGLLPEVISLSMVLHKAFVSSVPVSSLRLRAEARALREHDQALDDAISVGLRVSAKSRLWNSLRRAGARFDAAVKHAATGHAAG